MLMIRQKAGNTEGRVKYVFCRLLSKCPGTKEMILFQKDSNDDVNS